ncbi:hypothetical protein HD597_005313 [Nonomuraea thailandensis]|uniref:Flavin reductase like domain-containing protein n=1 Tax=Nonomuraea thailandensis TaxID=1188745 RepID=A0A9X2GP78_9ACTN|nr:hypothetical protein [Nonomuraea thailandensis]MCP2358293.1 hypothetical protein [Nonomuraea thailandensis]
MPAIPSIDLAAQVADAGNTSGRDTGKRTRFGFIPVPATTVDAPLVAECFAILECTVADNRHLWILKGEWAWIDPGRRSAGQSHLCGDGTFSANAATVYLRHP